MGHFNHSLGVATVNTNNAMAALTPTRAAATELTHLAGVPVLDVPSQFELLQQGYPVEDVYLVKAGIIKLIRLDEDGNELIVGLRSAGAVLGAASAILHKPHPVSGITLSRCSLYRFPVRAFLGMVKRGDDLCWHLHRVHSGEVYDQANQMIGLKYRSARQRVENMLWDLAKSSEEAALKSIKLEVPLKQREIAQLIGITPEHLSRVLKQLEDDGILSRVNGSLNLIDLEKLYHFTDA